MSDQELETFVSIASTKGLRAVCLNALRHCMEYFGTRIPEKVLEALNPAGLREPAARYLAGGYMRQLVGGVMALPAWGQ